MDLTMNMSFSSIGEAKDYITDYLVSHRIRYLVARSNRTRFSVHCQNLGCTFAINVFKSSKMNAHITKLVLDHTCDRFANLEVRASSSAQKSSENDFLRRNSEQSHPRATSKSAIVNKAIRKRLP
jgi:MuDR family transposase